MHDFFFEKNKNIILPEKASRSSQELINGSKSSNDEGAKNDSELAAAGSRKDRKKIAIASMAVLNPRQYDNELFWHNVYAAQEGERGEGFVKKRVEPMLYSLQKMTGSVCDESEAVRKSNGDATFYFKFDLLLKHIDEKMEKADAETVKKAIDIAGQKNDYGVKPGIR